MGQNLVLNMNDHGIKVAVYNRTASKTENFVNGTAADTQIEAASTLEELVSKLKAPRKVMMLVKAGEPVDSTIEQLLPLLDKGDIIIDGGNSNFEDTERRARTLKETGIRFLGMGVSGGEEGARHGPSLMPGGDATAWPLVKDMHEIFAQWNKEKLDSYLIEITADILAYQENGEYVLDTVLDRAGQKGTGKWTGINALELGIPLTLIGEAVFARCLSAIKDERVTASKIIIGPSGADQELAQAEWVEPLGQALYAAKIISYAQGFMLMRAAAEEYNWTLNYGGIAQMWRGGCIIRSAFLDEIKAAFDKAPELQNLLLDDYFRTEVEATQQNWRKIVAKTVELGIPVPAMSSALAFFDGYRTASLPANLLQAQRDYFGAHTYQKVGGDGSFHHTDWIGSGGGISSTTYNA
ncbi:UNVERIFIED_CONTAM: hypothetical protein GTU68_060480 [Idotea baltica]|nr:hypothetical protein [Idotea baltica]